jgi:hypothetical protein
VIVAVKTSVKTSVKMAAVQAHAVVASSELVSIVDVTVAKLSEV